MAEQLSLNFLDDAFDVAPPRKTLQIKVKPTTTLTAAVSRAYEYVQDNKEGYTSVEFKFGRCYIVVAKLKEKNGVKEDS